MKRWLLPTAVVVVVAGVLHFFVQRGTPSSTEHSRVVLRLPLEGDLQTLDPSALSDPVSTRVVWQVFEGLVGLDDEGRVVPVLAASWEAREQGRQWVFQLRRGVLFHDHPAFDAPGVSQEVEAADVVFSLQRVARGFGSFVFQGLVEGFDEFIDGRRSVLSGVRATGPHEVTISLTRPDPAFIHRISSPYLAVMSQEVVESEGEAFGHDVAVGTGPFVLVERLPNEVRLMRNPGYWGKTRGNIDELLFRVAKNPQLRAAGLRSGAFDLISLPPEVSSAAFEGNEFAVHRFQTFNVHYLGVDAAQVQDAALRRAISLAIDRERIVESVFHDSAVAAAGPIPLGMLGYESPVKYRTDSESARALVESSGYQNEELALLVSDAAGHGDAAQLIQADLTRAGVRTRIDTVNFNAFVGRLFSAARPPLFLGYSEWVFSAPEVLMEQFLSTATPNPNVFGYKDTRVDQLLALLSKGGSREERNRTCGQIETQIAGAPPAAWLFSRVHLIAARPWVSQLEILGNNHWRLDAVRIER